jgi:hypothetical protein
MGRFPIFGNSIYPICFGFQYETNYYDWLQQNVISHIIGRISMNPGRLARVINAFTPRLAEIE